MRRAVLLALAAAAALAVPALAALAAKEKAAPRAERRFDHDGHAAKMKAAGKGTEGCAGRCHRADTLGRWVDSGKKEHTRCFEGCHTYEASCDKLAAGSGKVCVACHVNLKEKCVPPGTARLTGRAPEYPAQYSHKKHIRPGRDSGQQCEGCHGAFGSGAPRKGKAMALGHALCADCHDKALEPIMNQCTGCHDGKPAMTVAARPANPFATTGAFDHQRHARADRVGTSGKDCLACHANIAQAPTDAAVPLPTMQGCYQTCHDGKKAFSAVADTCTRCHKGGRK
jgi:hypothetical protein